MSPEIHITENEFSDPTCIIVDLKSEKEFEPAKFDNAGWKIDCVSDESEKPKQGQVVSRLKYVVIEDRMHVFSFEQRHANYLYRGNLHAPVERPRDAGEIRLFGIKESKGVIGTYRRIIFGESFGLRDVINDRESEDFKQEFRSKLGKYFEVGGLYLL